MSSHPNIITLSLALAAFIGAGFSPSPARAEKRARGKAAGKSNPYGSDEPVARAGKNKGARSSGRNKTSTPPPALAPKDERDVTADVPPATTTSHPPSAAATGAPPKARVYTFGGLDVTGNLKAPQMLFLRGRVQQELDTSSPEKRSFLKELEKTADAKGL